MTGRVRVASCGRVGSRVCVGVCVRFCGQVHGQVRVHVCGHGRVPLRGDFRDHRREPRRDDTHGRIAGGIHGSIRGHADVRILGHRPGQPFGPHLDHALDDSLVGSLDHSLGRTVARRLARCMAALGGALAAVFVATAAACEPPAKGDGYGRIEGTRYVLAFRPQPPIRVGEFFALELALCAREGQPRPSTLRVDAQMPAHRHGMNYRASVRPQGPGRFIAEGLLLHMPGRWDLRFDINAGAARESLQVELQVD